MEHVCVCVCVVESVSMDGERERDSVFVLALRYYFFSSQYCYLPQNVHVTRPTASICRPTVAI